MPNDRACHSRPTNPQRARPASNTKQVELPLGGQAPGRAQEAHPRIGQHRGREQAVRHGQVRRDLRGPRRLAIHPTRLLRAGLSGAIHGMRSKPFGSQSGRQSPAPARAGRPGRSGMRGRSGMAARLPGHALQGAHMITSPLSDEEQVDRRAAMAESRIAPTPATRRMAPCGWPSRKPRAGRAIRPGRPAGSCERSIAGRRLTTLASRPFTVYLNDILILRCVAGGGLHGPPFLFWTQLSQLILVWKHDFPP